jgi:hypothetical protein
MDIKHSVPLMGRTWAEDVKYEGRYLPPNEWKEEENEENFITKSFMICSSHQILFG